MQGKKGHDAVAYVTRSKTDQEGEEDFRFLARDTCYRICAWVMVAGVEQDKPLFVPISAMTVASARPAGTQPGSSSAGWARTSRPTPPA